MTLILQVYAKIICLENRRKKNIFQFSRSHTLSLHAKRVKWLLSEKRRKKNLFLF